MPTTEVMLWKLLRDRRLEGLKFRRQVPIGPFVGDFVCFEHRILIEADGPLHDPNHDMQRDDWLKGQGFQILRFRNDDIKDRPHELLAAIREAARR